MPSPDRRQKNGTCSIMIDCLYVQDDTYNKMERHAYSHFPVIQIDAEWRVVDPVGLLKAHPHMNGNMARKQQPELSGSHFLMPAS